MLSQGMLSQGMLSKGIGAHLTNMNMQYEFSRGEFHRHEADSKIKKLEQKLSKMNTRVQQLEAQSLNYAGICESLKSLNQQLQNSTLATIKIANHMESMKNSMEAMQNETHSECFSDCQSSVSSHMSTTTTTTSKNASNDANKEHYDDDDCWYDLKNDVLQNKNTSK